TTTHVDSGPGPEASDWKGTARYDVLRCIGRGGMGVVYEAFDRERQQHVALKTLLNSSPGALYLFKQEFRTLADVHHRNLVQLYELVVTDDDRVFFTMELVNGTDFLAHVQNRASRDELSELTDQEPTRREQFAQASGERVRRAYPVPDDGPAPKASPADLDRLRPALCQLVDGVRALHAAGKLHRDIKPSNVRVTPEGRVVLLDFGVATELSRVVDDNLQEGGEMVGTARYMAPEQAVNEGPTAASDWYSVGVMLYEALVGSPPFVGSTFDVLKMKSMLDPPPPADRRPRGSSPRAARRVRLGPWGPHDYGPLRRPLGHGQVDRGPALPRRVDRTRRGRRSPRARLRARVRAVQGGRQRRRRPKPAPDAALGARRLAHAAPRRVGARAALPGLAARS